MWRAFTCAYVCVHFVGMCTYVHMPLADCVATVPTCTPTLIYCLLPLLPARVGTKDQIGFILPEIHIAKDDVLCFLVLKSYQHSFLKHPAVSLHCLMKVMKKSNKGKKKICIMRSVECNQVRISVFLKNRISPWLQRTVTEALSFSIKKGCWSSKAAKKC